MSERVLAIIWIGGELDTSRADILLGAINNTAVYAEKGDLHFAEFRRQPRERTDGGWTSLPE